MHGNSHSAIRRGRECLSATAEPSAWINPGKPRSVELKRDAGSSRESLVVTFFGLTGCWHALDLAVAERPGPTTPRCSTLRRDDHVKTTLVNKVILGADFQDQTFVTNFQ